MREAPQFNGDPAAQAEAKAALEAMRKKAVETAENMSEEEMAAQLRADYRKPAEGKGADLVELGPDDLEEIPEAPKVEKSKGAEIRMVEQGGSESGEIVATTEHKAVDKDTLRERSLRNGEEIVRKFLEAGQNPEVLQGRLEAALESAEDALADLDDVQDNMKAKAQLDIDIAVSQLQELKRLLKEGGQEKGEEVA